MKLPLEWTLGIRLYRGPMLIILFFFLIGGNTYGWRTSGVNHVLIFELDPRHHLTYQQFLEVSHDCRPLVAALSLVTVCFNLLMLKTDKTV